jgi:hypothetical protein
MEIATCRLLKELDRDLVVTGCKDAYPFDHGFQPALIHPDPINHRADACVYDTSSNERQLIDFTFTNAAKSSGINGAKPGRHADEADALKEKQYSREFPGFGPDSKPALVILSMERHGSWSQGTIAYWDARVKTAHDREVINMEFPTPLSVLVRRARQTLAVALWRTNAGHIAQFHRRMLRSLCVGGAEVVASAADPSGSL